MIETIFLTTFSPQVSPDDTIILAVSGGVDSMIMLDLVKRHHPREQIIVAHFDHSLRGLESDGDRELVASICDREGITFEFEKMDIACLAKEEKSSIESTARKYRYEFLFRVAKKYTARYILIAHHADDRIETALFHLIRGTKLGGIHALKQVQILSRHSDEGRIQMPRSSHLSYVAPISSDARIREYGSLWSHIVPQDDGYGAYTIFRPLLSLTKQEILAYASSHEIDYRDDSSNAGNDYQRNYLRHEVLPKFEIVNPEYRRAISNFIEYTEDLKSWIDDEVRIFLGDSPNFSVGEFEKKSPFFQREVIRYLYEQANSGTIGLSEGNIEEILRYILTANGGTEKKLGHLVLSKKSHIITLTRD